VHWFHVSYYHPRAHLWEATELLIRGRIHTHELHNDMYLRVRKKEVTTSPEEEKKLGW
jgi:hypothetical protein